uniref:Putative chaperone protein dnaj n=1 Tax=Amblyomma triste TaxID=251400 RepID=A0A023GBX0_AMBTT
MGDYYDILEVRRDAPAEEIKKCYRKKVLQLHPDKSSTDDSEKFVRLNIAWKTLCDEQKRREYDATVQHRSAASNPPISEEVRLSEMSVRADGIATWSCRCGGEYVLPETPSQETLIGCDACSFHILVLM